MVFFIAGAAIVSAIVTGITSYFVFKPTDGNSHNSKVNSEGEIYNNVQVAFEQNNAQNGLLVLLVAMLALMKAIEFILYIINAHKRSLKKRYTTTSTTVAAPTQRV